MTSNDQDIAMMDALEAIEDEEMEDVPFELDSEYGVPPEQPPPPLPKANELTQNERDAHDRRRSQPLQPPYNPDRSWSWATGLSLPQDDPLWKDGKTWADPAYPRIDPQSYELERFGNGQTPIPRPPDPDLDLLFLSELAQMTTFGVRTWEAIPLVKELRPGPNDASEVWWNKADALEPNESEWLRLFRKDHWLNLHKDVVDSADGLLDAGFDEGDIWSVDDPRIWRELRKAINLADHLLKQAVHTEWIQTMFLWPWKFDHREGQVDAFGKAVRYMPEIPAGLRMSPTACLAFLESPFFHQSVNWCLDAGWKQGESQSTRGVTSTWSLKPEWILISIDCAPMVTLLNPWAKQSSKNMAIFELAATMFHELMHAVERKLAFDHWLHASNPLRLSEPLSDPFYHDEEISEPGHSASQDLFGLDPTNPLYAAPADETSEGPSHRSFLMHCVPWISYVRLQGPRQNAPDLFPHTELPFRGIQKTIIPSGWLTAVNSKDFWKNWVGQYGVEALKAPRVLSFFQRFWTMLNWTVTTNYAEWNEEEQNRQNKFVWPYLERTRREFHQTRSTWSALRPWYAETRARWTATPYSDEWGRTGLSKLMSEIFAEPRVSMNEFKGQNLSRNYSGRLLPKYIRDRRLGRVVPAKPDPDRRTDMFARCVKHWFYQSVFACAVASYPARSEPLSFYDETFPQEGHRTPSATRDSDPIHKPHPFDSWLSHTGLEPQSMGFELEARFYTVPDAWDQLQYPWFPSRGRTLMVDTAKWYYDTYCMGQCVRSVALDSAAQDLFRRTYSQIDSKAADYDGWLNFDFVLPAYDDQTLNTPVHTPNASVPGDPTEKLESFANFNASHHPPQVRAGDESMLEVWTGLKTDTTFEPGAKLLDTRSDLRRQALSYLTLGQLYDRMVEEAVAFAFVRTGVEIEVYREKEVSDVTGLSSAQLAEEMTPSVYGPVLNSSTGASFYRAVAEEGSSLTPFARVAQWRRAEEVALQDGTDGKPRWIMSAGQVFDITDLDLGSEQKELTEILKDSAGGNPGPGLLAGGYDIVQTMRRLQRRRIGVLMSSGWSTETNLHGIYTKEEMGWYQFAETRMLVAIHGDVYDITDYAELHPGGLRILSEFAGRDLTELFEKYHPDNGAALLENIKGLRVGRLVDSFRPLTQTLGDCHVRLRDYVFDIEESDFAEGTRDYLTICEELFAWETSDLTETLENALLYFKKHPLVTLYQKRHDLIAGKVVKETEELPIMTPETLASFNGDELDEYTYSASFVSVGRDVLDMTTVMRFGPGAITKKLDPFIGKAVTDKEIGELLLQQFPFRIVGQLPEEGGSQEKQGASAEGTPHVWSPVRIREDLTIEQIDGLCPWEQGEKKALRNTAADANANDNYKIRREHPPPVFLAPKEGEEEDGFADFLEPSVPAAKDCPAPVSENVELIKMPVDRDEEPKASVEGDMQARLVEVTHSAIQLMKTSMASVGAKRKAADLGRFPKDMGRFEQVSKRVRVA